DEHAIIDDVAGEQQPGARFPEPDATRRMTGKVQNLEAMPPRVDRVAFDHEPGRLHAGAAMAIDVVTGVGHGVRHEFGELDATAAPSLDLLLRARREAEPLDAGPAQIIGLGGVDDDR